ncbi:hypothetical protein H2203_001720 [Taxawa tesnikishii (nom. ined.)]|nr:hypothetical protein H2203_001720 [Dothideales sp. JES 119]
MAALERFSLGLEKLAAAVGIRDDDSPDLNPEEVLLEQINKRGQFLTVIETEYRLRVNLVHQSAKNCLLREIPDISPEFEYLRIETGVAHKDSVKWCLEHLQGGALTYGSIDMNYSGDLSSRRASDLHRLDTFVDEHLSNLPFLMYAVPRWTYHARRLSQFEMDAFDFSQPFLDRKLKVRRVLVGELRKIWYTQW